MAMKKTGNDTRQRVLLITGVLVMVGGLLLAWLPDKLHSSLWNGSREARATHAQEETDAEIKLRFEQGVAMLNAKEYEHALTAFHRVLALSPTMPEAHVNAGFALLGLKRYAIARDFFEGAIALRKNQINAYYGLAEALDGLGDVPGALGAMRTYLHLSPPNDPYHGKAEAAVREWGARVNEMHGKVKVPGQAVPGQAVAVR